MQADRVIPSGYCKGVINAISLARKTRAQYPDEKIYIMGMLVHNHYVVQAFSQLGIVTLNDESRTKLELLDEISEGVVIFTAHGIDPRIRQHALDRGLKVVDATCSDVTRNAELCQKYLADGYDIIYIGKARHPESEAVLALSDRIRLVTCEKDIDDLQLGNAEILVTNQTTMSILDTAHLIERIRQRYPKSVVVEEICSATRRRQQAILDLKGYDTLIVVGDPKSNNTAQLASIARGRIKHIYKVEKASDLLQYDLSDSHKAAVTAGASTPSYLTDQLISYLRTGEKKYLEIDLNKVIQLQEV
ncbi:MAG: 4-hydroxy-3-methylbut-2-enyl diphosphate reductase [Erysipelotrichaceae bacterium]|nr:4-hydroxy-3-methylbut-2-enyl diphosphate reductase [Erysipelotrichaceae bacterium]